MKRLCIVIGLMLGASACGNAAAGFVGSYQGTIELTSGTRTVKKTEAVSITPGPRGAVVTIQMPIPTPDKTPPSSTCSIPASVNASGDLQFDAYDCPAVIVGSPCAMTLKIATGTGTLLGNKLNLSGSGTLLAAKCGQDQVDVTDSFSFQSSLSQGTDATPSVSN